MKPAHLTVTTPALALAIAAAAAHGQVMIDFEAYAFGAATPTDDEAITSQFNTAEFFFTTFTVINGDNATAFFEQAGDQPGSSPEGFASSRGPENADSLVPGSGDIGEFFLRASAENFSTTEPFTLRIDFNSPALAPSAVAFDLLDLDGNQLPSSPAFGTERWDIYVTDAAGNRELAFITPEIAEFDVDFDSKPFNIALADAQGIASIELVFSGTKETGIGVAFDNFFLAAPIPAPGAAALATLGLLAAARRRR